MDVERGIQHEPRVRGLEGLAERLGLDDAPSLIACMSAKSITGRRPTRARRLISTQSSSEPRSAHAAHDLDPERDASSSPSVDPCRS